VLYPDKKNEERRRRNEEGRSRKKKEIIKGREVREIFRGSGYLL
jgi:hypothetical protein